MKTPFSEYLAKLLTQHGAAAALATATGVSASLISRIAKGGPVPEIKTFTALLTGLEQADRNALTALYLELHRPETAKDVQIIVATPEELKDRLTRASEKLDTRTRDALADIIEGVNRAPDQGIPWLRNMAALLTPPDTLALAAETPGPRDTPLSSRQETNYARKPRR